jgi:hypothetical protein
MTLAEFYSDQVRAHSDERSFGNHWSDEDRGRCQVAWVRDTGELIVVAAHTSESTISGGGGIGDGNPIVDMIGGFAIDIVINGVLHRVTEQHASGEVEIIAVVHEEELLQAMLAGWEEQEQSGSGLRWLRDQF